MRMIWDTRMANCWFSAPAPFPLASAEALTSIECNREDSVYMIGADLEVAFYQFALPPPLRPFSACPGLLHDTCRPRRAASLETPTTTR